MFELGAKLGIVLVDVKREQGSLDWGIGIECLSKFSIKPSKENVTHVNVNPACPALVVCEVCRKRFWIFQKIVEILFFLNSFSGGRCAWRISLA